MRTVARAALPLWSPADYRTLLSIHYVDGHPHYVLPPRNGAEADTQVLVPMIAGGAYDNVISRSDAAATIPEDVAAEFTGALPQASAALTLFSRANMARGQQRLPVLSALPVAYFVSGDTGLKQTTEAAWTNVYLNAEEIACIVLIPDAVMADSSYDLWGAVEPRVREAVGRTLDAAIFFGTNKPASWPEAIVPAAVAAGNVYARGTNDAAAGGISEDFNQLVGLVEADGYDVNGYVTTRGFRRYLRGARNAQGDRFVDLSVNEIDGQPVQYAMSGMWPSGLSAAEVIAGDFTQGMVAVRQDITMQRSNQAVIQDGTGAIVYNTFQQDMTAFRVTFRAAWAVPNPINYDQAVAASRYPFGVLRSPAA